MNYMRFNEGGDLASMITQAQGEPEQKKEGFTLVGQYAKGPVRQETMPDGSSREYVMYEMPDGSEAKIYGNWNEYAVTQDQEGYYIGDEDYPIMKNERGEYELDEMAFELKNGGGNATQQMAAQAQGGPSASGVEDLLEQLTGFAGQGMR